MKTTKMYIAILMFLSLFFCTCTKPGQKETEVADVNAGNLKIGWASVDITPDKPVVVRGSLQARVSEGVMDPITATVLALESGTGQSSEKFIMVSCDLIAISDGMNDGSPDNLRDKVRALIRESVPEIGFEKVILNGTHTHAAPDVSPLTIKEKWGVELDAMELKEYLDWLSVKIAQTAVEAWNNRSPGGISYGLGHAVVGHNRLQVAFDGSSYMYGELNRPEFSHIEGYEDHSVNILYTWDSNKKLTGVVVNLACTSQVTGGYLISADFWHDTRVELRDRLGEHLFVLPQVNPAGDQSPRTMVGREAEERMIKMMYPDVEDGGIRQRKEIARRISDAVCSVLAYMPEVIEWDPVFAHKMEKVELSRRLLSKEDVDNALINDWHNRDKLTPADFKSRYEKMLNDIEANPALKEKPRWYGPITNAYIMMKRGYGVRERYELEKVQPKLPIEIHALRIGDMVIATNPFELYLDYGMRIKARSPAVQTFLVQLAGDGTYLPTERAIAGGSYGAAPTSTLIGPEGGQELVESTLRLINSLWGE